MVTLANYPEIVLVLTGIFCGLLIGLVAVGGVLMVPILHLLAGFTLQKAITISITRYIFTSALGVANLYGKTNEMANVKFLIIACLIGAALGSLALNIFSSSTLTWFIAATIASSVLHRLRKSETVLDRTASLSKTQASLAGIIVGFGSAISGTGGRVLLLPFFSWIRLPLRSAILLAQAIQLPIAGAATRVTYTTVSFPVTDVLLASVSLLLGNLIGIRFSRKVSLDRLIPRLLDHDRRKPIEVTCQG
jgi:uncharacterized membrane protein YfcA